jgi:site-specific recombinase XerD
MIRREFVTKFSHVKLPECAVEFLELIRMTSPHNTARAYTTAVKRFYDYLNHQSLSVAELERVHIQKLVTLLKQDGLLNTSIGRELILIRGYLRWLFDSKLAPHPAEFYIRPFDLPKKPQFLPRALSPKIDSIVQNRLSEIDHETGLAFLLMRKTGLRISELSDLVFEPMIGHGDGFFYLRVKPSKVLVERLVPLDSEAVEVVRRIQQRTRAKVSQSTLNDVNRLIISRESNPYSKHTLILKFRDFVSDIRDEDGRSITSHQLRHTYATQLLNAGMSLLSIMKILGHRSPNMTLRYAQVTPDTLRQEYFRAIDRIKSSIPQLDHKLSPFEGDGTPIHGEQILNDFTLWLRKKTLGASPDLQKKAFLLERQIEKIKLKVSRLEQELS